jgi:hypothetical protein
MHQTPARNRRTAFALAGLLGLGLLGGGVAAADIDDITSCPDPTHGEFCEPAPDQVPDGPDEITDVPPDPIIEFPAPTGDPLPEAQPTPDADPDPAPEADVDLPDAEVDGTVVADATFTG